MKSWVEPGEHEVRLYEAISKVFLNHQYLLRGFFEERQPRISLAPEEMIQQSAGFSDGEIVLIKIALDIWSGSGNACVWELLEVLDKGNFLNVLKGMLMIKQNNPTYMGPLSGTKF